MSPADGSEVQAGWVSEVVTQMPEFLLLGLEFGVLVGVLLLLNRIWKSRELNYPGRRYLRLTGLSFLAVSGVVLIVLFQPGQKASIDSVVTLLGVFLSGAIALSSTTFIGNIMAGIMLSKIDSFHPGDYLAVGVHMGRVTKMGLLHTEIQTEHSNLTTFPNMYLITNPCKVVRKSKTVVSADVSLGYDIQHSQARKLLIQAAEAVPLTDPFVQVLELGDFSVTYRASGVLENAKHLLSTRSRLREEMLDALHGAGIEIVSPTFMNSRSLSPREQVLSPADSTVHPGAVEKTPETVIFDMADEAESIENLRQRYERFKEEVATIKGRLKGLPEEEESARLKRELGWRETSLLVLEKRIQAAAEDHS